MNYDKINGVQLCFKKKFSTENHKLSYDLSESKGIQLHFKRKFTNVKNTSHFIVWKRVKDEHGRIYYWNIITNETAWKLPTTNIVLPSLQDDIHSNSLFINRKKNQVNEVHIETCKIDVNFCPHFCKSYIDNLV